MSFRRPRPCRRTRFGAEPLEPRTLLSASLVRDINNATTYGSDPTAGVEFNGAVYYAAIGDGVASEFSSAVRGHYDLWRTDLATGQTALFKELPSQGTVPPAFPTGPRSDRDSSRFFFTATNVGLPGGNWLWSSDGTPAGTTPLHPIDTPAPLQGRPSSIVPMFAEDDGIAFFSSAATVWRSDGTLEGTRQINKVAADFTPGETAAAVGKSLFFASFSPTGLWKTDGTEAGTVLVKAMPQPLWLTAVGDTLFFVGADSQHGRELWKSDGTADGTAPVRDIRPGTASSGPTNLVAAGDTLYFAANDGTSGVELWKSDGTDAGTVRVRDVNPGTGSGSVVRPVNVAGTLFFFADDGVSGLELWKSDGTETGTVLVSDANPGPTASVPSGLRARDVAAAAGGLLYFAANDGVSGTELWKSDGTAAGTTLVRDVAPGSAPSGPTGMIVLSDGRLFFSAAEPATGTEPHFSDGTSAGTVIVRDLNENTGNAISHTAPYPQQAALPDGSLLFAATDGVSGVELWRSDGTAGGTRLVKDIRPGPGGPASPPEPEGPSELVRFGDVVYFAANDGVSGRELWRTDGTSEGTVLVADVAPGAASSNPLGLIDLGGTLFFWSSDGVHTVKLYKTDGTAAGTSIVYDTGTGVGNRAVTQTAARGTLYSYVGSGLYRSDGTTAGTRNIGYYQGPVRLLPLADSFVFTGAENTVGSRTMFYRVADNGSVSTVGLAGPEATVAGGAIYFRQGDGRDGQNFELWKSDGTAAGTRKLKEIRSGIGASNPTNLRAVGNDLLFTADDGVHGAELWRSDGTEAGTVLVSDLNPGPKGSAPGPFTSVTRAGAYFTADDDGGARALWFTDGTPGRTSRVTDAPPGAGSSAPVPLAETPLGLFFDAFTRPLGRELWHADPRPADAAPAASIPGPLAVAEGASLPLYGFGPFDAAAWEWDFDYDGQRFDVDATGPKPTFPAAGLDGPSSKTVALRVTSAGGVVGDVVTAPVAILPAAPVLDLAGGATSVAGSTYSVTLTATDAGPDTISSWTLDWGDGTTDTFGGDQRTATHVYQGTALGLHPVVGTATDEDGTYPFLLHTPVGLDPAFGAGGVAPDPTGAAPSDDALGVPQPAGKFITVTSGRAVPTDPTSALAWVLTRYDSRGTPDPTFGEGGVARTVFAPEVHTARVTSAAAVPGGDLVAAGFIVDPVRGWQFIVARYRPDGTPDPAFGVNGIARPDFGPGYYWTYDVAVDALGRVLVAGAASRTEPGARGGQSVVARLKPDGSLDESFDGDGRLGFSYDIGDSAPMTIAVAPDGKILVGGVTDPWGGNGVPTGTSPHSFLTAARINADGGLDAAFGQQGLVRLDVGAMFGTAYDLAIQPDGRIVLAGDAYADNFDAYNNTHDWAVARLLPDGTPDPGFGGGDGVVVLDVSGAYDQVRRVLIQQDGRILVAGAAGWARSGAIGRLLPDGTPDPTFNSTGVYAPPGGEGAFSDAMLQPDGKLVLVRGSGDIPGGGFTPIAVVRYLLQGVTVDAAPAVVARHVFYNGSALDGADGAASPADDAAVAADKQALLPGGTATFANVTSYMRGLNGIMIDVATLPGGAVLTADDFELRIARPGDAAWSAAPMPSAIAVRRGAGTGGSDRVTLVWPDGAVRNGWLRVTLKAGDKTGLAAPDVFSFGNLVGESGDPRDPLRVTALDLLAVRRALSAGAATADSAFDFNRDGRVNALDLAAVRLNLGRGLASPPAPAAAGAAITPVWDERTQDLLA